MAFFHGTGQWSVPLSITETSETPEGLDHLARNLGAYILRDLPARAPDKHSIWAAVAGVLLALVRAFGEESPDVEADAMVAGIGVGSSESGRYMLMSITGQVRLTLERLEAALRRVGHDPEAMEPLKGAAAQAWFEECIAEGEARGKAVGIAEGMSEALVRLLKHRFGPLPDGVWAHIAAANLDQLDRWLDAVLDAPTLEVVIGGASEHR